MIQTRSDLSNALIPEGTVNAGRSPIYFDLAGILVRLEVVNEDVDLTPYDVRRIVIDGALLTKRREES